MRRRIEWGLHGYWELSQAFEVSHQTMHTQRKKVSIGFFLLKNIFLEREKGKLSIILFMAMI